MDFRQVFIFVFYIVLFTAQSILVKLSQTNGSYTYNTTLIVLLTEVTKLMMAGSLALTTLSPRLLLTSIMENKKLCLLYMLPAGCYCLHNNLVFVSLSLTDPATYFVLLQIRVLVTGLIYQYFFKKTLTKMQWISLLLLFIGVVVKEAEQLPGIFSESPKGNFFLALVIIMTQVFFSSLAGVFTEFLLKGHSENANIHLQNVFMYVDSLVANVAILVVRSFIGTGTGGLIDIFTSENLSALTHWTVIAVLLNGAVAGITTAYLLKYLDSVLKIYANSIEIVLVAFASWMILGIPVTILTSLSLLVVSVSLWMYKRYTPIPPTVPPVVHSEEEQEKVRISI